MLHDRQVVWIERFPALHRSKRLADQLEVGGESSLLQITHGVGYGHVGLDAHIIRIKHHVTLRQPVSSPSAHADRAASHRAEADQNGGDAGWWCGPRQKSAASTAA